MSVARLYNTKEAILVRDLMISYRGLVFKSDYFKGKFITFEEYLLYTLKLLNNRRVSKEKQIKILYEYEFLMNFPSYILTNIYEKQVDYNYFSIVMSGQSEEQLRSLKKKEKEVRMENYVDSSSEELMNWIDRLEKSYLQNKELKDLFEKIKYNRVCKDVKFYDLYFKNLSFDQISKLDEFWKAASQQNYSKDVIQSKWIGDRVFDRFLKYIGLDNVDILEINYDLYDDLESLSKFMGDSQQDYSDTDCDPHSLGNSKNLKNNNFKKWSPLGACWINNLIFKWYNK